MDSRTIVEEFLGANPDFIRELRSEPRLPADAAPLPPDHELKTLARVRRRLGGYRTLLTLAMVFSMTAFGRIVWDTSWDVSPRNFIITAAIAAGFWTAYLVSLWRMRATILIVPGSRRDRKSGLA
jgi:hypothetical protein